MNYRCYSLFFILVTLVFTTNNPERLQSNLLKLKYAYPNHIKEVFPDYIVWYDGTIMPVNIRSNHQAGAGKLNNPTLAEQLELRYIPGKPLHDPQDDPGRIRYQPFFLKMYGNSSQEVENNLEEIEWMPKIFGNKKYILKITKINGIAQKLKEISKELEILVLKNISLKAFLENPGGTYCWRPIANSTRLSTHCFGISIDINSDISHYWQWDLNKLNNKVTEQVKIIYKNNIPWEIVNIFEKYGFIWGGKWYHYDTMHFEYRPELFT